MKSAERTLWTSGSAIHGWSHVIRTCRKMVDFAKVLNVCVAATEQNPEGTASSFSPVSPYPSPHPLVILCFEDYGTIDAGVGLSTLPPHLNLGIFNKATVRLLVSFLPPSVKLAHARTLAVVLDGDPRDHVDPPVKGDRTCRFARCRDPQHVVQPASVKQTSLSSLTFFCL